MTRIDGRYTLKGGGYCLRERLRRRTITPLWWNGEQECCACGTFIAGLRVCGWCKRSSCWTIRASCVSPSNGWCNMILEAEMTEHVGAAPYGAAPYERAEGRTGQRNGYKPRAAPRTSRVGTLDLLVPQGTGKGPSAQGSSAVTGARRRRSFWRLWRCMWGEPRPGRSRK